MNIYDVLRKLVEARGFTATDQAEAIALITELEGVGALGTTAGRIDKRDHVCEAGGLWFPQSMQCKTCGGALDPPSHGCIPSEVTPSQTGWGRVQTQIRCKICNREMA